MRITILISLLTLSGCNAFDSHDTASGTVTAEQSELSRGYALLHELVSKQSGLDGSLILRPGMPEESKSLIREIDASSERATQSIQAFAKEAAWMDLKNRGLPGIEIETRDQIESATTRSLLFAGDDFELRLLLTQTEATGYGRWLAEALKDMDNEKHRRDFLARFAEEYGGFHTRVEARLTVRKGDRP